MYYIVYALLYLVSLLPFRVLHIISDGIYLLLYHGFKYRRDVVLGNLQIAFPEKTEAERIKIAKEFYSSFIDNFIETVKLLSMSERTLNKHFKCENKQLLDELYLTGQSVQVHLGHFFNWEMANAAHSVNTIYPFLVVYMPIKNKVFERLFVHLRKRFGTKLISANSFRRDFLTYSKEEYCLVLVGDQNAGSATNAYWLPFFGKMAPFVRGPERGAHLNNTAVVMGNISKVKRGYYKSELVLLTTDPRSLPEGEITRQMIRFIEDSIRKQPSNYLWSHRRWKVAYDEKLHGHLKIE
ncbi:lysophospholipid acyltransferase family protein [Deminuibacter soli]|uniref:Lipid A biosynthesis acyltransferase n=1 Tax=Deminuibacter soli TaxID=2291815 RepID=A0A3E1NPW3_9BACT|nr:lipid A biosynthesis acyltransferase [Deminuibacter soli]RFM29864.1 lipid A biosynthesis acyltransferase [Deminuibacter soli]